MKTGTKIFGAILDIIAFALLMAVLLAVPTTLIWNAVVPDVFGLPVIDFVQALLLNFLAHIFFKNGSRDSKS